MLKKIVTELHCVKCDQETAHTVVYLEDEIQRIKCQECESVFGIDKRKLIEFYTIETAEHILTKPFRLNKELREKGVTFLFSLPKRVFTKPYRIAKELLDLFDE